MTQYSDKGNSQGEFSGKIYGQYPSQWYVKLGEFPPCKPRSRIPGMQLPRIQASCKRRLDSRLMELGNEAKTFYKRLASLILASKWDNPYNNTMCWLRCRLSFSLLRSVIMSIRGARSSCGHAVRTPTEVDL